MKWSGAAALAVVLVAVVAGCGKKPPPEPPQLDAKYVAIGDSYTAVSGISPDEDGCKRSDADYPALVAKAQGFSGEDFVNASCGGAALTNLTAPFLNVQTQYTNSAQLDAVSTKTELVTMGIGGNPVLSRYLECLADPTLATRHTDCKTALAATRAEVDAGFELMVTSIEDAITSVAKAAPNARVVVVGYPRILPDQGSCPEQLKTTPTALEAIRHALDEANETFKTAAANAGADYVDTFALSEDHDICSDDPWMNGEKDTDQAYAFHPLPAYHQAVAARIDALLAQ